MVEVRSRCASLLKYSRFKHVVFLPFLLMFIYFHCSVDYLRTAPSHLNKLPCFFSSYSAASGVLKIIAWHHVGLHIMLLLQTVFRTLLFLSLLSFSISKKSLRPRSYFAFNNVPVLVPDAPLRSLRCQPFFNL